MNIKPLDWFPQCDGWKAYSNVGTFFVINKNFGEDKPEQLVSQMFVGETSMELVFEDEVSSVEEGKQLANKTHYKRVLELLEV